MRRPLPLDQLFPAGNSDVAVRTYALETGVRLRVLEAGPRDGSPVVMLHGWGASAFMFRDALALLPAHGMRAIAVDLRGFGLSDKPRGVDAYSLNSYCADLDALLDALALPRAALVGQSMGGGLALRYALGRPDRVSKLALINPTGLIALPALALFRALPGRIIETIAARPPRAAIAATLRYIAYGDPSLVTERTIDEYWSMARLPGVVHAARSTLVAFDWRPVTDAEAASLSVPTLVMLGDRDRLIRTTLEDAARLRGATVERVVGGHCVNEEHPGPVYQRVAEFIAV